MNITLEWLETRNPTPIPAIVGQHGFVNLNAKDLGFHSTNIVDAREFTWPDKRNRSTRNAAPGV